MPVLLDAAGLDVSSRRSHGFVQVERPDYVLSIADRGADALVSGGRIGIELAEALKAEARRRVQMHTFFGHVAYLGVVARGAGDADVRWPTSTQVLPPTR